MSFRSSRKSAPSVTRILFECLIVREHAKLITSTRRFFNWELVHKVLDCSFHSLRWSLVRLPRAQAQHVIYYCYRLGRFVSAHYLAHLRPLRWPDRRGDPWSPWPLVSRYQFVPRFPQPTALIRQHRHGCLLVVPLGPLQVAPAPLQMMSSLARWHLPPQIHCHGFVTIMVLHAPHLDSPALWP